MNQDVFAKRLNDLANQAYLRGIPTFTDYLDLSQQTEYMEYIMSNKMPPIKTCLNGGLIFFENQDDFLERKISCFYPEEMMNDIKLPVSIIEIKPLNMKFSDELSHRDFLGALMNLGIERHLLGDILVKNNVAYVFAVSKMSNYICDNLTRIRHTSVSATICDEYEFDYTPMFKEEKGSVAAERLDAIIAFAFNMSRSEAAQYILAGKVFVCAKEITSKSHMLKFGDIVSVRGKGRFIFDEILATTKKGRFFIKIRKYI